MRSIDEKPLKLRYIRFIASCASCLWRHSVVVDTGADSIANALRPSVDAKLAKVKFEINFRFTIINCKFVANLLKTILRAKGNFASTEWWYGVVADKMTYLSN